MRDLNIDVFNCTGDDKFTLAQDLKFLPGSEKLGYFMQGNNGASYSPSDINLLFV